MKRIIIRISGRVQGVFFRASTKDAADRLSVHGIVRNELDGSVYIEAEGNDDDLLRFTDWCRKGPPHARVDKINLEEAAPKGDNTFRIVRQ